MKVTILKPKSLFPAILLSISLFLGCTSYNIPNQTSGAISNKAFKGGAKDQGPKGLTTKALIDNDKLMSGLESRESKLNKNPYILREPLIASPINNHTSEAGSLGITLNNEVAEYLMKFHLNQRRLFEKWLERSGRYLPLMREILRKHGLPEELVYVAMIESGLDSKARSSANACGPWQLVPGTGLKYGLKINSWIDERQDPVKSTEAAAKYFRDLYTLFGCWVLTVASYNAGEGTVLSAIEKADSWDYWDLAKDNRLPSQTTEFVPKFMAATIIGKEYEEFGFKNQKFLPPLKFDYLKVKGGTPLKSVARYSGISYEEIKRLNPELKRGMTPPNLNTYKLKIPCGFKKAFLRDLDRLEVQLSKEKAGTEFYHRVKKGDTLWKLSRRYKVSVKEIKELNRLQESSRLQPNQILRIPGTEAT